MHTGNFDGIGFNPAGTGIGGIDLDHCVIDGKPTQDALQVLESLGAKYVELSPSGKGLRAFGLADPIGKVRGTENGVSVELFTGGQYLTLTGNSLCSEPLQRLTGFQDLATRLRGGVDSKRTDTDQLNRISKLSGITQETVEDVRSALESLDPAKWAADYEPWTRVGMALKSLGQSGFEEDALAMWRKFSRAGDEIRIAEGHSASPEKEIDHKWRDLTPTAITYKSIFKWAGDAGWQNPRKTAPEPLQGTITRVSMADVLSDPPAPQRHAWGQCVPFQQVTLLGAHGGTGKSMFAIQLAVHVGMGLPFMGRSVEQGRVVFFSAEDDANVLRRRIANVCATSNIEPSTLDENVTFLDATGAPVLYREHWRDRSATFTDAFTDLESHVRELSPSLVVIDNASDTYDANEIDRGRVREFVRGLVNLGREADCAVMLLVHVAKVTARGSPGPAGGADNEAYSGSTAWHNSARSRLSLSASDDDDGQRVLELKHLKSNLGDLQPNLRMRFTPTGTLTLHGDQCQTLQLSREDQLQADRMALLKLIDRAEKAGERIGVAPNSTSNAFKSFCHLPAFPKQLTSKQCDTLLRRMKADGLLKVAQIKDRSRNVKDCWALTEHGETTLQGGLDVERMFG